MNTTNLSSLSFKELSELEKAIEKEKEIRKDMRVYKVTFYVGFKANRPIPEHPYYDDLMDTESFGNYLVNTPTNLMIKELNLKEPEDISGFYVEELEPKNFPSMFKLN